MTQYGILSRPARHSRTGGVGRTKLDHRRGYVSFQLEHRSSTQHGSPEAGFYPDQPAHKTEVAFRHLVREGNPTMMSSAKDTAVATSTRPTTGSTDLNGGPSPERITVNLSPLAVAALALVTGITDANKTEAINKALRFYGEVTDLIAKGGAVYIREPGEKELERVRIV